MKKSSINRVWFALLVLALSLGVGQAALTLTATEPGQEFILCAPDDRIVAVASRHGLTIVRPLASYIPDVYLVRGPVPALPANTQSEQIDAATQALLNAVRADPDVDHFDINAAATITEISASPHLNESTVEILDSLENTVSAYFGSTVWAPYIHQPALNIIKLAQAQQLSTGTDVVIAVIDTGVDPNHPALQGSLVPGYDFTRDLAGPGSEWPDLDESTVEILDSATVSVFDPTAPVAVNPSTVAMVDSVTASQVDVTQLPEAFGHGTMVAGLIHVVAPSAKIMPLKAFKADGTSNAFDIERAIYYAVDHGAKIINMSFSTAKVSAELTHAIDYASAHGVICLASAGNTGKRAVVFPGGYRNVMGIASTTDTDVRSTFSNYGDHLVKFAAPGEALITLYPGRRYAAVSGTSFSTALVAGGAALLSKIQPAVDIRVASRHFDDGALKKPDWELGDGRVDLYETLLPHSPVGAPPPLDAVGPVVTVMSPAAGALVNGLYPIAVNATDNVGVVAVEFKLDGVTLGETAAPPYGLNWDTSAVSDGAHVLSAIGRDAAGNESAASISVTVTHDASAPEVTVTSPAGGASITAITTIAATASDDVGVVGVRFTLDGVNLGAEITAPPYSMSWNSATAANGAHVLAAVVRDAAGRTQTANGVNVTVNNDTTAPTVALTTPVGGATLVGTSVVTANASDDVAVAGVQFTVDGTNLGAEDTTQPYEATWNTTTVANGTHVLAAVARDAAGNSHAAASVSITVYNDTTAPTTALTSPDGGATITGSITVGATASDDVAVVGVQFTADGANLGAEDTTAPYEVTWNSGTVSNGTHVLGAVARDATGNTQPASVSITVNNDTTAPTVSVTSPAHGATVTGSIALGANASDDVAVAGVQFTVDGTNLGAEDTTAPYEKTWNSATVANGTHMIAAVARDAAGNTYPAVSVNITVDNDTTAPAVALTSPAGGATVVGGITLSATASDNVGVVGVQFTLDGANLGAEDTTAPYEATWNSTAVANGTHVLTAVARDGAGNTQTATSVSITVDNDTAAPAVALTSPAGGATVVGGITLSATASDNVGVVGVQFTLDGANLGAEDTTAPYEATWNSTAVVNGTHVLTAVARDAAGNTQTATSVSITVDNDTTAPAVALNSPGGGATVVGGITLSATASDNVGVVGVQFTLDGANLGAEDTTAPYEATWNSTAVANGTHVLTAVARDAAGNTQTATSVSITVDNDTTAPAVALNSPGGGATVVGGITLSATASDNVGVVGVQFTLDGANLGAEDTTAPYEATWNSTAVANGTHVLTAVARDAAGNTQTATSVSITVDNDTTAPTVALNSPGGGATVVGGITLSATASDNVGVVGVQFTLDGANLGAEDTTAPYEATWNSTAVANGTHVLTAVARDAAGNTQTATSVSITVDNDTTAPTVTAVNPTLSSGVIVGSITVGATASDNVGVAGVQFALDGVSLGAEVTAAPYELAWDSTAIANGAHVLTMVARDAAGNQQTATVNVIVANLP